MWFVENMKFWCEKIVQFTCDQEHSSSISAIRSRTVLHWLVFARLHPFVFVYGMWAWATTKSGQAVWLWMHTSQKCSLSNGFTKMRRKIFFSGDSSTAFWSDTTHITINDAFCWYIVLLIENFMPIMCFEWRDKFYKEHCSAYESVYPSLKTYGSRRKWNGNGIKSV